MAIGNVPPSGVRSRRLLFVLPLLVLTQVSLANICPVGSGMTELGSHSTAAGGEIAAVPVTKVDGQEGQTMPKAAAADASTANSTADIAGYLINAGRSAEDFQRYSRRMHFGDRIFSYKAMSQLYAQREDDYQRIQWELHEAYLRMTMEANADPIDLSTGNKVHVQIDHRGHSNPLLGLARNHQSLTSVAPARITIPHGLGWRSEFDRSLAALSSTHVQLHQADGKIHNFVLQGGAWVPTSQPAGTLVGGGSAWTHFTRDGQVESYDGNGRLTRLAVQGQAIQFVYSSGRLVRVDDGYGRSLSLAYDGAGRLQVVTLPDALTVRYTYDGASRLTHVTYADQSVRQYHYEDARFPAAMTGITDESGRRLMTFGYDVSGRANYSHYGQGTDRVEIQYAGTQVVSTDVFGVIRERDFAALAGQNKIVGLRTLGKGSRAPTGWTLEYDHRGLMSRIVDRTGAQTLMTLDGNGRILQRTRAAGTAVAQSLDMTWHPYFRLPVRM